ncbi:MULTISPECIES: hypothetical protein [unclassified Bradyrhizobium]|uniref:hypothetical protein n=1 Tax=unclassified Bradyrhizobium TaxID=2631580 RepID=UPI0028E26A95|nr:MULTISPECIES: hypothetical protein [unclassified Bradyrhizobium]
MKNDGSAQENDDAQFQVYFPRKGTVAISMGLFWSILMRSTLFKDFGIPDAECDIESSFHPQFRVPYLFFRSTGNPLVGLDLTGASQLRQRLAQNGDTEQADEIDRLIQKARQLG